MAKFIDGALDFLRRKRVAPTKTIGGGGTAVYGGFIQSNESNTTLTGRERYITYSEILANTSIVAASVRFYLNLLSKAQWTVDPNPDGGAQAEQVAEQIEAMIYDMTTPWHRIVRRAGMYKFYGYSWQEWTAKRNEDGTTGFMDIEPRPQRTIERWDLDETGTVHGVVQRSAQTQQEIYLPRAKALYMVDDSLDDSPEGLGILRHLAEPHRRLQRYLQLEGFSYETDLRGIPFGSAPYAELNDMVKKEKISAKDRAAILAPMETFIENHIKTPQVGIMLDSIPYADKGETQSPGSQRQWNMELLKGGSNGQGDVANAIERTNREMARVIGTEHLLLGESGAGSLAMARDKSANFALIVASTLQEIGESADSDLITPLMQLNGWDESLRPTLKPEAVQHREISEITTALRDLAASGGMLAPDDPAINTVRALLGLPEIDLEAIEIDSLIPDPNDPTNQQSDDPTESEDESTSNDIDEEDDE